MRIKAVESLNINPNLQIYIWPRHSGVEEEKGGQKEAAVWVYCVLYALPTAQLHQPH